MITSENFYNGIFSMEKARRLTRKQLLITSNAVTTKVRFEEATSEATYEEKLLHTVCD
jgi:hypothetical protein